MTWLKELKEGDEVFAVYSGNHRKNMRQSMVAKVGRKWLTIYGGSRFDRNQELSKGYAYEDCNFGLPCRIYQSEKHYNQAVEMSNLKNRILVEVSRKSMSDDQALQIAEILGMK